MKAKKLDQQLKFSQKNNFGDERQNVPSSAASKQEYPYHQGMFKNRINLKIKSGFEYFEKKSFLKRLFLEKVKIEHL
ncbi:hypothetical protein [uncultured Bacteroides sp.]|uniref:hypothetical protein n=1 Tax=uncultured Bacteroides sp. TaxID=162156 RepID=UPI00261B2BFD|nr:hypothetical protein [uncultured Bacteroides sp.]